MIDVEVSPKIKLAALWASVMFCYIYADYFGLFMPGRLAKMNQGQIPPLGQATDAVMIGVSLMLVLPSVMIFLSVALPARPNRILNLIMGTAYTAIIAVTMAGGPAFILFYGVIEMALTLLVVYYASTWPRA
jgi:hypothetical protein